MNLASRMIAIAERIGAHYTLKNRSLSYSEVFSDIGLMPGLAKRADQLSSLCLGYGLGASYEDVEESLLGMKVTFCDLTSELLRVFFITDVLYEIVKTSPNLSLVSLDELMYN